MGAAATYMALAPACQTREAVPDLDASETGPAAANDAGPSDAAAPVDTGSDTADTPDVLADANANTQCSLSDQSDVPVEVHSERIVQGLSFPWALEQLPNGDWLITERGDFVNNTTGTVRLVRGGRLLPTPVKGAPVVAYGPQGGMFDIALHPDFATNHYVYLSYVMPEGGDPPRRAPVITRYTFEDDELRAPKTIYAGFFLHDGDGHHGGRMVFGHDRKLYLTLGEAGTGPMPQELDKLVGKTLRLNDDGTIPADNPFVGRADARPEVFTYGHRNPQGIAVQPSTGNIFNTEHGPTGCDEINWLRPGRNYGWPHYTCNATAPGIELPLVQFTPSEAPSGAFFYTGRVFKAWCHDMFVAALAGQGVLRLRFNGTSFVRREKYAYFEDNWRIRDVAQGRDGFIYYVEDVSGGLGYLKRLVPGPRDADAEAGP
jgi:glucose/arabinose dehydrogenase